MKRLRDKNRCWCRWAGLVLIFSMLLFIMPGCEELEEAVCEDGKKPDMVDHINDARSRSRSCGDVYYEAAGPVQWNELLADAAQNHSDDMADNDFFSHTGSDGSSFSERIARTVYAGVPMGENIHSGSYTSESAVNSWLDSPGHCAIIMNPDAAEIGAAANDCKWTLVTAHE